MCMTFFSPSPTFIWDGDVIGLLFFHILYGQVVKSMLFLRHCEIQLSCQVRTLLLYTRIFVVRK